MARLALDDQTKIDAYKLRYKSYLACGFIEPNKTKMFSDRYDELTNSHTIVLYSAGTAIASIRTSFLSMTGELMSPGLDAFQSEINTLLRSGRPSKHGFEGVELTRLVRTPDAYHDRGLVFLLLRLAGYLALRHDVQVALACVRQQHRAFYKRLKMHEIAAPKPYPGLNCSVLLLAKARGSYEEARNAFPIIDPGPAADVTYEGFAHGEFVSVQLCDSETRGTAPQR